MIIPIYIAFGADEYTMLNNGGVEQRRDAIKGAIETSSNPVTDIDVVFVDTADGLAEVLDRATVSGIVFGAADWDGQDLTDGMRINTPEQVADFAHVLEGLDPDDFEEVDAIDILTDFYTAARTRGDAIAVYFN